MPSFHGFTFHSGDWQSVSQDVTPGKYGRMFPQLPPLFNPDNTSDKQSELKALEELGTTMMATGEKNNENIPSGYTYFGQFVDHDITFDITSLGETIINPLTVTNYRTPKLDLDSLYGGGAKVQPYLYQRQDEAQFQLGKVKKVRFTHADDLDNDLPRSSQGFALISDPRNDENLIIAQLHLAFLKFHNKVVREIRNNVEGLREKITSEFGNPIGREFEVARKIVIWHYQWIVIHDFLPKITNLSRQQIQDKFKYNQSFSQPNQEPFIPIEFSVAAFRLGHSMIRERYQYNPIFSKQRNNIAELSDLFSFTGSSGRMTSLPDSWIIDWRRFFNLTDEIVPNFSQCLNTYLVNPLKNLVLPEGVKSLPIRNLIRGWSVGLPSGQSIANFLGFQPLTPEEILEHTLPDEKKVVEKYQFHLGTPLWYYILKEAEVKCQGKYLGEVGASIVLEVFIQLLKGDKGSFILQNPNWKPLLPVKISKVQGDFTMADLIAFIDDINPTENLLKGV